MICQLSSQVPSNSKQMSFLCSLYEEYIRLYDKYKGKFSSDNVDEVPELTTLVPEGTILTIADKGLGFVLLPIEWYVSQFAVQAKKGGHIVTNMTAGQCLNHLSATIQNFRNCLGLTERLALKKVFKPMSIKITVGLLKLIPKIHKIKAFDSNSWKQLPSRPIRGAERCPLNPYSKALCTLLQDLHKLVRVKMGEQYPLVLGVVV